MIDWFAFLHFLRSSQQLIYLLIYEFIYFTTEWQKQLLTIQPHLLISFIKSTSSIAAAAFNFSIWHSLAFIQSRNALVPTKLLVQSMLAIQSQTIVRFTAIFLLLYRRLSAACPIEHVSVLGYCSLTSLFPTNAAAAAAALPGRIVGVIVNGGQRILIIQHSHVGTVLKNRHCGIQIKFTSICSFLLTLYLFQINNFI